MKNCGLFAVGVIVGITVSNYLLKEKPKPLPCKEENCCCAEKPKPQKKCYYQRYYR